MCCTAHAEKQRYEPHHVCSSSITEWYYCVSGHPGNVGQQSPRPSAVDRLFHAALEDPILPVFCSLISRLFLPPLKHPKSGWLEASAACRSYDIPLPLPGSRPRERGGLEGEREEPGCLAASDLTGEHAIPGASRARGQDKDFQTPLSGKKALRPRWLMPGFGCVLWVRDFTALLGVVNPVMSLRQPATAGSSRVRILGNARFRSPSRFEGAVPCGEHRPTVRHGPRWPGQEQRSPEALAEAQPYGSAV